MKRAVIIALLFTFTLPVWSATRAISVEQLQSLLSDLQKTSKSDVQVADELKMVTLTEELTGTAMQSFGNLLPGPLSTEQIYVLQARSSMLPPPASLIPQDAAPDATAQQSLLTRAQAWAGRSYTQLPHLAADRLVARFQDGVEAVHSYSGMNHGSAEDSDPLWQTANATIRLVNTRKDPYEAQNGVEKKITKDTTNWGANNLITPVAPPLTLPALLQEAVTTGNPHFLRWQRINDRKVAVFDFAVDRKKTKFLIHYCCFPSSDTAGMLSSGLGISQGAANGGTGNLQTTSEWKPFKTNAGYHGQLFIDAETGIVLRTITIADLKKTDFVHAETLRTDYGATQVAGKALVVPLQTFTVAEIVPNGDSFVAHYAVRHMMVTETWSNYKLVQ